MIEGTATLTNTSVYENRAGEKGGGVYVYEGDTARGEATLTNSSVYQNEATTVRSFSQTFCDTSSSAPLDTNYVV